MVAQSNPATEIARRLSACERHAILAAIIWAERRTRPAPLTGAARLLFAAAYSRHAGELWEPPAGATDLYCRHLESYLRAPEAKR